MRKKESNKLTVLGVCAHPDDLDAAAGGTFAKWAKEGAACYYLICTNGEKGSLDKNLRKSKLIETRKTEQRAAARILGIKDVFFLDYKDTELVVDKSLKRDIVYHIRKLRPDIVVTTDPTFIYSRQGFINHSDHRAAGLATIDAIYPLAKNSYSFEEFSKEGIMPHAVKSLYLINFSEGNEIIDISDTIDQKVRALSEHKSQALSKNTNWIREMSGFVGKRSGYRYAESFVRINFFRN